MLSKAYAYCVQNIRKKTTPKYVKLQMRDFMRVHDGKDSRFMISEKRLQNVEKILRMMIMPKGLKAGETVYDCATGCKKVIFPA